MVMTKKTAAKAKAAAKRAAQTAAKKSGLRPPTQLWKVYDTSDGEFVAGDHASFKEAKDRAELDEPGELAVAGPYVLAERRRQK